MRISEEMSGSFDDSAWTENPGELSPAGRRRRGAWGRVFRWATATIPTTNSTTSDLGSAGPIAHANGSHRAPFASRRSCAEVTGASVPNRRRGLRPPPASALGRAPAGSSSKRTCTSSEGTAPKKLPGTCGTSSATVSRGTARRACRTARGARGARNLRAASAGRAAPVPVHRVPGRRSRSRPHRLRPGPDEARRVTTSDGPSNGRRSTTDTDRSRAHVIVRGACRERRQLRMGRA